VGKSRTLKALLRFFREFGKERSAFLLFVCSDMWKPYLTVIAKKASQAIFSRRIFQFFWEHVSPEWAGRFLDDWYRRTMRSRIEPMKRVARMLRSHRELLLNWFRAKKKISGGIVEGFNNRAKLTTRKAYGFGTFEAA